MRMLSRTWPRLVSVLLILNFCILPSKAQGVYHFCDNSSSNVVNINPTSRPVLIQSPNYGSGTYGDNQYCSLVIRSGEDPLILYLKYNSFSLEHNPMCHWDSLCVHGVKFCGNWEIGQSFAYILPENSSFTLTFKTDGSVTATGFQVNVTTELATSQSIDEVTDGVGSSQSNINSTTVTYQPGFPYIDKCVNPPVYNSTTTTTPPVYNRNTTTTPLYSTATAATTPQDFTIPVTTLSPTQDVYYFCANTSDTVVNINANSAALLIGDPQSYYNARYYYYNQGCPLVIRSGGESLILYLHYNDFHLVYEDNCAYDSLCVYGVNFCGDWKTGKTFTYILPEHSSFTLRLKPLYYGNIEINVTAELATNQWIEEVTGGVGSSENNITTTAVTYYPGFPYTDRCENPASPTPPITTPEYTDSPSVNMTKTVYHFCDNSTSNIVNINAASPPILIQSPNFGNGTYDNNQYCSLVIKSGRDPLILSFYYSYYDLENTEGCGFDWLCVHGLRFCGNWETGHTFEYILPENSIFTVIFRTDTSVIRSGLQILVSQELATNQIVEEATGGNGYHDYFVLYSNVTYYPGYRDGYRDRCSPEANPTDYLPESNTTITDAPVTTETIVPTCVPTHSFSDVDAALVQAINSLNRARALLRQQNEH